jgi:hypothetical protein
MLSQQLLQQPAGFVKNVAQVTGSTALLLEPASCLDQILPKGVFANTWPATFCMAMQQT